MVRLRVALIWASLLVVACSPSTEGDPKVKTPEPCLAGTGNNLDCSAKAELHRSDSGKLVTEGAILDVPIGALSVGSTANIDFSLVNTIAKATASALRIDDITVTYEAISPAEQPGNLAFSCLDGAGKDSCLAHKGKWRKVVPAGSDDAAKNLVSEERFIVRYKHFDNNVRTAKICVVMVGDAKVSADGLCFKLQTRLGKPKIDVAPQAAEFQYVPTGKPPGTKELKITNVGDVSLCIKAVDFTGDPSFTVLDHLGKVHKSGQSFIFDPPVCLDVGTGIPLTVVFTPADEKKKEAKLVVHSTDAAKPLGVTVLLLGNSKVPCLSVEPSPQVNFGAVVVGGLVTRDVKLCNCGSELLSLSSIALQGGGSEAFALDFAGAATPSDAAPLVLAVNACTSVKGRYTPVELSPIDKATGSATPETSTLQVTSNAPAKSVQLLGVAVKEVCPQAKIKVTIGNSPDPVEEVPPQTVLHLSGSNSSAPGGASIASFLWSVKKHPEGTPSSFVPSATFPNPTYAANAAGEYQFCLVVTDTNGQASCEDVCSTVFVTPSDALHVELLWDTPADTDQANTGPGAGSDMDLHFANPLASPSSSLDLDCDGTNDPWFQNPFDCFWFNTKPEWGSISASVQDNPTLDLDDTDGAGPENLNLQQPEGTVSAPVQYELGVHFWNDHGWGASYATVKVYILGTLFAEFKSPEMKTMDMWYVGRLNWPNVKAGGGKDVPVEPCFQSGDACLAKKDPTDPKGGKMWQPTGDACIKHCYSSPLAPTGSAVCL